MLKEIVSRAVFSTIAISVISGMLPRGNVGRSARRVLELVAAAAIAAPIIELVTA